MAAKGRRLGSRVTHTQAASCRRALSSTSRSTTRFSVRPFPSGLVPPGGLGMNEGSSSAGEAAEERGLMGGRCEYELCMARARCI